MKAFIVVRSNLTLANGKIVKMMDDGFSECLFNKEGKYTGTSMITIPHQSLIPFMIPFMLEGQFVEEGGKAWHAGHPSGDYREALNAVVFNPPSDDEDWIEEFL